MMTSRLGGCIQITQKSRIFGAQGLSGASVPTAETVRRAEPSCLKRTQIPSAA